MHTITGRQMKWLLAGEAIKVTDLRPAEVFSSKILNEKMEKMISKIIQTYSEKFGISFDEDLYKKTIRNQSRKYSKIFKNNKIVDLENGAILQLNFHIQIEMNKMPTFNRPDLLRRLNRATNHSSWIIKNTLEISNQKRSQSC